MLAGTTNTTTTEKGAPFPASRYKIGHSQSFTLTTLGGHAFSVLIDGHAMPSIFAATPAASTKLEKLMDALSDPTSLPAGQAGIGILSGATPVRRGGRAKDLSVPVARKQSFSYSIHLSSKKRAFLLQNQQHHKIYLDTLLIGWERRFQSKLGQLPSQFDCVAQAPSPVLPAVAM